MEVNPNHKGRILCYIQLSEVAGALHGNKTAEEKICDWVSLKVIWLFLIVYHFPFCKNLFIYLFWCFKKALEVLNTSRLILQSLLFQLVWKHISVGWNLSEIKILLHVLNLSLSYDNFVVVTSGNIFFLSGRYAFLSYSWVLYAIHSVVHYLIYKIIFICENKHSLPVVNHLLLIFRQIVTVVVLVGSLLNCITVLNVSI